MSSIIYSQNINRCGTDEYWQQNLLANPELLQIEQEYRNNRNDFLSGRNFERVEKRMANVQERDAMKAFQSPVRGDEIMKICGLKEGKSIGKIKTKIESAILNGDIENTHEAAMDFLLKKRDEILS